MPDNGSNGRWPAWISRIPTTLITVLLAQFLTLVIWAIRLDQRVQEAERKIEDVIKHDTEPGKVMAERIRLMEERQKYLIDYVIFIREELARIAPPSRPVPPLSPPSIGPTPQQR